MHLTWTTIIALNDGILHETVISTIMMQIVQKTDDRNVFERKIHNKTGRGYRNHIL